MNVLKQILSKLEILENRLDTVHSAWMTVKETAAYARVSESKVRKLIASGDMPIHRIGGKILISRRELDYLILFGTPSPTKRQREKAEGLL